MTVTTMLVKDNEKQGKTERTSCACECRKEAPKGGREVSVLDPCCGARMFWFDRHDPRAVFCDVRCGWHVVPDVSSAGGSRKIVIAPDIVADFVAMPFSDATFWHVVFDPPHLYRVGKSSWLATKYGRLEGDWRDMLRKGFAECFRVLKPNGTLIFKWGSKDIPLREILELTPERPLYGHKSGKRATTHWVAFIKGG